MQRLVAEKGRDHQTIRFERAIALDELADRIIGPVQGHGVDHQIMRALFQVEHIVIGNNARIGEPF